MMHFTAWEMWRTTFIAGRLLGYVRVFGSCVTLTHGLYGSCSCGVTQLQGVDEHLGPPLSTSQRQLQHQRSSINH